MLMAKGWIVVKTVNDVEVKPKTVSEKYRNSRDYEKLMAKTKKLKWEDLKKEGEELHALQIAKEENIVNAFNDKRLKSKELIKQARKLAQKKNKKDTSSNTDGTDSAVTPPIGTD